LFRLINKPVDQSQPKSQTQNDEVNGKLFRYYQDPNNLVFYQQIVVVFATIAMCQAGVLPLAAGYVAPYASSFDSHQVNHAHAFAAAPLVAAPLAAAPFAHAHAAPLVHAHAAPLVHASPYVAAPALSAYSAYNPYLF
jgi:hypothetical protein